VLRIARQAGTPVAVAGGPAQQVWGRIRATRDIDLLAAPRVPRAFLEALVQGGLTAATLGDVDLVPLVREESFADIEVDLLLVKGGFGERAVRRAIELDIGGMEDPFVTAEDLILLKLLADRVLDRADVEDIVREQSGRLDLAYLRSEAATLGLSDRLEIVLKGA
jgi:hypothetical protein